MNDPSEAFQSLIRSRRSIRRFAPEPVPEAAVRRLLESACMAPSAHNRQPWRFVVVAAGEPRRRLAEAMAGPFRSDLAADGLAPDDVEARVQRSRERILEAPLLIVLCLDTRALDPYPDARRRRAEREMAVQSLALAGGHLLLDAHARGLGGCWMCAPLFAPEAARRSLDLPAEWEPQGMLLIGRPAEPGRERTRLSVDEVALWR